MHEPPHPGELLAEVIDELKVSIVAAAGELGVTRQTMHRVIGGTSAVTPEMALRLGKWVGNGPGLWLGMQQAHDLWAARKKVDLDAIPARHVA